MITQERLKELVHYDAATGVFTRLKAIGKQNRAGYVLGTKHNIGYLCAELDGKQYLLHRLAYLYHYGYIPSQIDHKDGDKTNNSIENLRQCTYSQNNLNRGLERRNTTGVKGVSWLACKKLYYARLTIQGKTYRKTFTLTQYGDKETALELATVWIKEIRETLCLEFTNHGNNQEPTMRTTGS